MFIREDRYAETMNHLDWVNL